MAERARSSAELDAVLFDLDGVLVDSYEVWFHLTNATASALGCSPISRETFRACWGQGIEADRERFYPNHSIEEIERAYQAGFPDQLEHLRVAPDVPAVFAGLRERGLASAVITNTPLGLARVLVERARAAPDLIVGGTDVSRPKPAPDMVLHACERLGIEPARALVVGDSRFDRDAAVAAGARFAGLGIAGQPTLATLGELLSHLGPSRLPSPSRSEPAASRRPGRGRPGRC